MTKQKVLNKETFRIFNGRTDAEASILWLPDAKNRLIGKILMLGKIEGKRV